MHQLLFERRDITSLVAFRVFFGLLMAHDAFRYINVGWVKAHYVDPQLTFKFVGFLWLPMLPGPVMYGLFGIMLGTGLAIAAGAYYRISATLYFLAHSYIFLIAAEYYLNHAYLLSVVALLMIFIPAHRAASIDALRKPSLHSNHVHGWAYWLLLGTLGVVYVYGAIAKMTPDWLVGVPVRQWLAHRAATAWSPVASLLTHEPVVMFVTWYGLLFDLFVTPVLLWKRTRPIGVACSLCFHLSNSYLFHIGVFPWFMLASTTLFFDPDWPRKLGRLGDHIGQLIDAAGTSSAEQQEAIDPLPSGTAYRRRVIGLLGIYFGYMILMPLRHHLYPGDVAWTEEGHNFSWRMKLRNKQGHYTLRVVDSQSGEQWTVDPKTQLNERQIRKSAGRPDMLLQYVHYLRNAYRRDFGMDVAIYADAFVSLNYRRKARIIDPTVNLAAEEHTFFHSSWITEHPGSAVPVIHRIERQLGMTARRIASTARSRP